ncbi:MAG: phosphotransferase, partial [Candidatus Heimdallarchaeota archaeon]|nr:phosphotransferase [Candidatus Heimdallarchaeota archaeon]
MNTEALKVNLLKYLQERMITEYPDPIIEEFGVMSMNVGMEATLYLFTLKCSNSEIKSADLILKLYNGIISTVLFDPKLSAKYEYLISRHISRLGIAVSMVIAYELDDNGFFDYAFTIMEKLYGEPLQLYLHRLDNKGEHEAIWDKLAEIMVKLHSFEYTAFIRYFEELRYIDQPERYLEHDLELWLEIVKPFSVYEIFIPFIGWLSEMSSQIPLQQLSIIHRDFSLGNFFREHDGRIVLIDWGISYLTDFRLALGYTLISLRESNYQKITRDKFLALYEEKSGMKVENIEFFEILALLKGIMISTILANFNSSFSSLGEAREFIKDEPDFKELKEIS